MQKLSEIPNAETQNMSDDTIETPLFWPNPKKMGGGGGREKLGLFRVLVEHAFLAADPGVQAKKTAGAAVQRASCPIC